LSPDTQKVIDAIETSIHQMYSLTVEVDEFEKVFLELLGTDYAPDWPTSANKPHGYFYVNHRLAGIHRVTVTRKSS
jgi:hypothetical protein